MAFDAHESFSPRDHHVAGQPPGWSQRAQSFRHLDGTPADWRAARPAGGLARRHRTGLRARLRRGIRAVQAACAFETILLGPSCNKRDVAIFAVGCGWGVMCAIGAMAAWGVHP